MDHTVLGCSPIPALSSEDLKQVISPSEPHLLICRMGIIGRKVMTNLDSIFKSRDITLPAKVHLVKAMVFALVVCGCESWTVKKAERRRIDAFELWEDS